MVAITVEDIMESNRIKNEICENCKKDLMEKLTPIQLIEFEKTFYSVFNKYLFSRKEN